MAPAAAATIVQMMIAIPGEIWLRPGTQYRMELRVAAISITAVTDLSRFAGGMMIAMNIP